MYIISVRKESQTFVKGYNSRVLFWVMVLYYKIRNYEINYGDD